MRGIKYGFFLTVDTDGKKTRALGTDALIRTDGRCTHRVLAEECMELLEDKNKRPNYEKYIGFILVKGNIDNYTVVFEHVDQNAYEEILAKRGFVKEDKRSAQQYVEDFDTHTFNIFELIELKSKVDGLINRANDQLVNQQELPF